MLGVIYKDLCIAKKEIIKTLIICLVSSLPLLFPWKGNDIEDKLVVGIAFIFVPIFVFFFIFIFLDSAINGLVAQDESRIYGAFISASPVTEKGQVGVKYIETIGLLLMALLWAVICNPIVGAINGQKGNMLKVVLVLFFLELFIKTIELPFIIRFGSKSGAKIKTIIMMALCYIIMIYLLFGPLPEFKDGSVLDKLLHIFLDENKRSKAFEIFKIGAPCLICILYFISYKISCRLYQKGVDAYELT